MRLWSANVVVGACLAECRSVGLTLARIDCARRRRPQPLLLHGVSLWGPLCIYVRAAGRCLGRFNRHVIVARLVVAPVSHLRLCLYPPPLSVY